MDDPGQIPERFVSFFRQVADLARANSLDKVSATLRPGWKDSWRGEVTMYWEQGRHGDASGTFRIATTTQLTLDIKQQKPGETP